VDTGQVGTPGEGRVRGSPAENPSRQLAAWSGFAVERHRETEVAAFGECAAHVLRELDDTADARHAIHAGDRIAS